MHDSKDTLSRRDLIHIGMCAGIALAVAPGTAWAVTTSAEGLVTDTSEVPIKGGKMPVYRAMPKGKGPFPTVIVVHEIFGVHAYIQDVCRRLAHMGYVAVAPYLYAREGDVTTIPSIDDVIKKVVSKVPQEQVMHDLDDLVTWLKDSKTADTNRMGITGFCWGGNVVWMYAAHNPRLKAGVAWYGRLDDKGNPLNPKTPLDVAAQLKVPVLGLYGGKDKGIPVADVDKMREALKKGKSGSELIIFPDAEHGFHADYRPSYNEKAAKEGWDKLVAWFKGHGVA